MTFDDLCEKIDIMDLQMLAGEVSADLEEADSCETISDLEANIQSAYDNAIRLLAELKLTLAILADGEESGVKRP